LILGADDDLIEPSNNRHMIELVLSWAKSNLDTEKPRLDDLTEQVYLFKTYMLNNNSLIRTSWGLIIEGATGIFGILSPLERNI
jgi:hypothetical protein